MLGEFRRYAAVRVNANFTSCAAGGLVHSPRQPDMSRIRLRESVSAPSRLVVLSQIFAACSTPGDSIHVKLHVTTIGAGGQ